MKRMGNLFKSIMSSNLPLGKALPLTHWRKVAIGTWKTAADPSVYGALEFDARPALAYIERLKKKTGKKITITHFVGKAVAQTLEKHPEVNCTLRFNRLYPRKNIGVLFLVASDSRGDDLSGALVRNTNQKSIPEIADELTARAQAIRTQKDPDYKKAKQSMGLLPGFLAPTAMRLLDFVMHTLNLWSPVFGIPKDSFGSAMITSVGSLGLDAAYAPLVPFTKVPILFTVGQIKDAPLVLQGQLTVAPVLKIFVTFDHRLIDGMHASHMTRTISAIFADPERNLDAEDLEFSKGLGGHPAVPSQH